MLTLTTAVLNLELLCGLLLGSTTNFIKRTYISLCWRSTSRNRVKTRLAAARARCALEGSEPDRRESQICEVVNLPALIEQIVLSFQKTPVNKAIRIKVDVSPDAVVFGDPAQCQETLTEVFREILEKTPGGGEVRISGRLTNGVVTINASISPCSQQREAVPRSGPSHTSVSFRQSSGQSVPVKPASSYFTR